MNPVPPVTRTASGILRQKSRPTLVKLLNRLHVIVRSADIEPVPFIRFDVYFEPVLEHIQHQVIKAELAAGGNARKHTTIYDVHTHADEVFHRRLFPKSSKPVTTVSLKHA